MTHPSEKKRLPDRLQAVYNRLWIDCERITQEDAETILEAVRSIRGAEAFNRSLCEAFNTGDGSFRP
jgi:hypothetical protein